MLTHTVPGGAQAVLAFEKKLLTLLLAGDAASSPRVSGSSFIDVHM